MKHFCVLKDELLCCFELDGCKFTIQLRNY